MAVTRRDEQTSQLPAQSWPGKEINIKKSVRSLTLSRKGFLRLMMGTAGAAVAGGMAFKTEPAKPAPKETSGPAHPAMAEPNIDTALGWWTELSDKWTVIGWKDHLFRFNVLFNGTIVAQPDLNRRTEKWMGQGLQLSFLPSGTGGFSAFLPGFFPYHDDGRVIQGWNDSEAPVLWSEWAWDGLILRQEVFAHVPGAQPIQSGVEPLFAWVRLSIVGEVEALTHPDRYGFDVKLNAPHIIPWWTGARNNLTYNLDLSRYPRSLTPESGPYSAASGYRLLEEGGKVRLGIAAGQQCTVKFESGEPTVDAQIGALKFGSGKPLDRDLLLFIQMDAQPGAKADLLVPMLPTEREVFDKELALGYDGALAESNGYWSKKPATAATIRTPEEFINQFIHCSRKSAQVIAERDPATGYYSLLTGSWVYANVWASLISTTIILWLDNFGDHEAAEKYLQVFKETQGTVVPSGKAFKPHPGYLGTPPSLEDSNWLTEHGALLWAIGTHVLVSGNKQYEEEWLPVVIRACDFIKAARAIKGHGGVEGIMPPAWASDRQTEIQGVWNDGWMYKGLITAVRLLKRLNHLRAEEFAREAQDYKEAFVRALREKTETMLVWTDRQGRKHHLVPPCLSGNIGAEMTHAFYLDAGPLALVFLGLLDASDELMRSTLLWFREGPPTKVYRYDSDLLQVPSLVREISSCEPCLSWNLFHSCQLGDRSRFLEGMYSLLTGGFSRQTFTMCEERGAITGLTPCAPGLYSLRLAVIDDQLRDDELHLMRLAPLAWLRKDRELVFRDVPTTFGPVSLSGKLDQTGRGLELTYATKFRKAPSRILLHVPPVKGLAKISLNGKALNWDGKARTISVT